MSEIFINRLKKAKLEIKQQNNFNKNYFVYEDAFSITSNNLANHKNTNCKKAELNKLEYMILDISVYPTN